MELGVVSVFAVRFAHCDAAAYTIVAMQPQVVEEAKHVVNLVMQCSPVYSPKLTK